MGGLSDILAALGGSNQNMSQLDQIAKPTGPQIPQSGTVNSALNSPPPPQMAVQQTHGIKGYLSDMFYQMGEAGKKSIGLPTDYEKQQAQQKLQLQQQQTQADVTEKLSRSQYYQAQSNEFAYQPLTPEEAQGLGLPPGTMMTAKDKANAFRQALKNRGATDVQQMKDTGAMARLALQAGMPMLITPEMAKIAGQPGMSGQYLSGKSLGNFMKMFSAAGASVKDLGQDGMWAIDRMGNRIQQVTLGSPMLERASVYANARSANTPVDVFDADGNLVSISQAQQLQTGAPKASTVFQQQGPTAATRTAGQSAGAVASHIPEFKQAIDNLAAKGQLGPVIGRANEFLTKGYGGSDPDVANFLTTLKLLKSGAVRAHFGARGGQKILESFDQTLNPAMTPEALKGSIDAIGSFLNTYGDIGNFKPNVRNAPSSKKQKQWNPVKGIYE